MKNLEIEINFILKYFKNKKIKKFNVDYMSQGYVDSLGFIKFVSSIEKFFNIKFNQKDFMNRNFRTINGLAQIISVRKKK
jgi:acyl carrier protein|tara:strand:+ start:274 stop:513 length:240 start_codon:yes stop_codon:yes gene_type:complete